MSIIKKTLAYRRQTPSGGILVMQTDPATDDQNGYSMTVNATYTSGFQSGYNATSTLEVVPRRISISNLTNNTFIALNIQDDMLEIEHLNRQTNVRIKLQLDEIKIQQLIDLLGT